MACKKWIFALGLIFACGLVLQAQNTLTVKMRFFEGSRAEEQKAPEVVTSSFLQPTVTANLASKFLLAEEIQQITKVFNLKDVSLITEADLEMGIRKGSKQRFRINGHQYEFILSPVTSKKSYSDTKGSGLSYQFQIEVIEYSEESFFSLLDTEIILPEKNIAVFGFEDRSGTPYFLSFHVTGANLTPPPPPQPPPPPPPSIRDFASEEEIAEFTKGAVVIEGELKPPRNIKRVEPVYPPEARRAKVSGVVILGVRTDIFGRVKAAKIYRTKDPLLSKAAVDAVKQWVYEPIIVKGEPRESVFTVTVRFKLNGAGVEGGVEGGVQEGVAGGVAGGVVEGQHLDKPPKVIKKVDPLYPPELRRDGIQGVVKLAVTTDIYGRVQKIKVLESESSLLNPPAIDAVKQWVYEPFVVDGKPRAVNFEVIISFKLR